MSVAFKQIKLYFKLVLIVLVCMTAVLVLCNNRKNTATVWFFKEYQDVNVLSLMVVTAIAAIVSFWILSMIFKVWREWRGVARETAEKEKTKQFENRVRDLEQRGTRIRNEARSKQDDDERGIGRA